MCEELKSCLQEKSLTAGFYEIYLNRLKKKKRNGRCQLDNKIFRLDVNIIGVLVGGHLSQEQSYNTLSGQIGRHTHMVLIES